MAKKKLTTIFSLVLVILTGCSMFSNQNIQSYKGKGNQEFYFNDNLLTFGEGFELRSSNMRRNQFQYYDKNNEVFTYLFLSNLGSNNSK